VIGAGEEKLRNTRKEAEACFSSGFGSIKKDLTSMLSSFRVFRFFVSILSRSAYS
jgi:hypothetical protein